MQVYGLFLLKKEENIKWVSTLFKPQTHVSQTGQQVFHARSRGNQTDQHAPHASEPWASNGSARFSSVRPMYLKMISTLNNYQYHRSQTSQHAFQASDPCISNESARLTSVRPFETIRALGQKKVGLS